MDLEPYVPGQGTEGALLGLIIGTAGLVLQFLLHLTGAASVSGQRRSSIMRLP